MSGRGGSGAPRSDYYGREERELGGPPRGSGGGDDPHRGGGGGDYYDSRSFYERDQGRDSGWGPSRGGGGGGRDYRHNSSSSRNYNRGPPQQPPDSRHPTRPPSRSRRPHNDRSERSNPNPHNLITFRSLQEEEAWVEDRRRKRKERPSKWDVQPTPEQQAQQQAAAVAAAVAASTAHLPSSLTVTNLIPSQVHHNSQQTRHARRLYVGNIPPNITEAQLQHIFTSAIQTASSNSSLDPILNVYIHHEHRFCFVEFKTVEMTTACMALDGLLVAGQAIKVKRPNDYNAMTAPPVLNVPLLDISRLGIIQSTVADGPNKLFIGGLPYHLQEPAVLELLQAFGKVKAFHLVKNENSSENSSHSKGYCFAEYADPPVTAIAVQGLNGMDIGSGKNLTARLAVQRTGATSAPIAAAAAVDPMAVANLAHAALMHNSEGAAHVAYASAGTANGAAQLPLERTIVVGFDIEEMVDAAMGLKPMPPMVPQYRDAFGQPLTRIVPFIPPPPPPPPPPPRASSSYGVTQQPTHGTTPTRILVLHNMVTEDDLATDEDYHGLLDEVRLECQKYGHLETIRIPRTDAARRIFLQYKTEEDAQAAQQQLEGRQFGDNMVVCTFASEQELASFAE